MAFLDRIKKEITVNGRSYYPSLYLNLWGNWTISYKSLDGKETFCAVCVEPNNTPIEIKDTEQCIINSRIGNAKTGSDALDMLYRYFTENNIN